MFQSRNRGSFDFKDKQPRQFHRVDRIGFNLVIEVLLISSVAELAARDAAPEFQSRNRGSFDFKTMPKPLTQAGHSVFQSRNRGSFDFKFEIDVHWGVYVSYSFNLVIEVLLISSFRGRYLAFKCCKCGFNLVIEVLLISSQHARRLPHSINSFNLVIEVLLISSNVVDAEEEDYARFQSRNRGSFDFKKMEAKQTKWRTRSFNLVIEVLLISSLWGLVHLLPSASFQSRNRGSFDFKTHRGQDDCPILRRFNLVIEVLLISRQIPDTHIKLLNLVSIS